MFKKLFLDFNFLNLFIASLALILSFYSIHYAQRLNRHKIMISNGSFHSDDTDPPIAWFEIHNVSPVPVTVIGVKFLTTEKETISPLLGVEPTQTYFSPSIPYAPKMPNVIPGYKYAAPLEPPQVIQPYNSIELGYYFISVHESMLISVTCLERIGFFRKSKSFITHFSDIPD